MKSVGVLTLELARRYTKRVVTVPDKAIAAATYTFLDRVNLLVEGAGAAPLAALEALDDHLRGRRVVLILTGGNIDARVLAQVLSER